MKNTAQGKAMTLRPLYIAVLVLAVHLSLTEAAVRVWGLRATGLTGDPTGPPDPYVKVWCGSSFGGMTEFHKNNANPSWSAEFYFSNCKANDILKLEVWDKDLNFDDHLGTCTSQVRSGSNLNINCRVGKGTMTYNYRL